LDTPEPVPGTEPVKTGHPKGFWFFFWGEFAERSSYYGMRAILALYMTERLGISKSDGGTFMALFIAACYFLPLLGGYLADNFFGKYWTIVGFSIPYVVGQFIVGLENKYLVFGALALLAMGSGVIKPNISTLMGMTYDQQRPGQEQLRSNAFSWFYLAINIGAFLSQLAVPWLRTEYSYQVAFLFPAGLMAVALTVFAAGKRFYAKEAIHRKIVGTPGEVIPDGRTITGLPVHTTVVTEEEKAADRALKLQTLGRIGSLFILVMFFWAIFDQSASTWIFFADTYMDLHLFGFGVTADQVQSVNAFFIMTLLPLSVVFFNYMANKGKKIRATDKMIAGFILTALSMIIMSSAGFLAGQKRDAVKITFKEGEIIVPAADVKLKEVKVIDGRAGNSFTSSVQLTAKEWEYDEDKKKASIANGAITFADGKQLVMSNGRIDFDKSRGVFASGTINPSGSLETKLKPGDYPMGSDKLTIDKAGAATTKTGEKVEAPKDEKPPKVTLEDVDWVLPAERVTVWWQILAFLVLTVAEILISVTGLELAFVAAPPTMKSFVTACWLVTVGMANLFINAPITRLYPHMSPGPYYAILAGALVVVAIAFVPVAGKFNRGMAAAEADAKEKAALENGTETT
jgi:POT family proton-dependent oligopeptide transporter